jgi:hypothetical protein
LGKKKTKLFSLIFQKKKTEQCDSGAPPLFLKNTHKEAAKCFFSNPAAGQQKLIGPTK